MATESNTVGRRQISPLQTHGTSKVKANSMCVHIYILCDLEHLGVPLGPAVSNWRRRTSISEEEKGLCAAPCRGHGGWTSWISRANTHLWTIRLKKQVDWRLGNSDHQTASSFGRLRFMSYEVWISRYLKVKFNSASFCSQHHRNAPRSCHQKTRCLTMREAPQKPGLSTFWLIGTLKRSIFQPHFWLLTLNLQPAGSVQTFGIIDLRPGPTTVEAKPSNLRLLALGTSANVNGPRFVHLCFSSDLSDFLSILGNVCRFCCDMKNACLTDDQTGWSSETSRLQVIRWKTQRRGFDSLFFGVKPRLWCLTVFKALVHSSGSCNML